MQVGDKVVCINNDDWKHTLTIGKEYTCTTRLPTFTGRGDMLYLYDLSGGYYAYRFRELEKMQETNFIELVGKGE
jgi:hypothetical protein